MGNPFHFSLCMYPIGVCVSSQGEAMAIIVESFEFFFVCFIDRSRFFGQMGFCGPKGGIPCKTFLCWFIYGRGYFGIRLLYGLHEGISCIFSVIWSLVEVGMLYQGADMAIRGKSLAIIFVVWVVYVHGYFGPSRSYIPKGGIPCKTNYMQSRR